MGESGVFWLAGSVINVALWIPGQSDDRNKSVASKNMQVTSKQGQTRALSLGSECSLGAAAGVQSIVCCLRQAERCLPVVPCVVPKLSETWLSNGLVCIEGFREMVLPGEL